MTYDDSEWPVLEVTLPPTMSDDEFAEHLRTLRDRYLVRREPHVTIIDVRALSSWHTTHAAAIVQERRTQEMQFALYRRGVAIVGRPPDGGAASALEWLFEAPYPVKVFNDLRDAREWASGRMRGLSRPYPRGDGR